MGGARRLHGLVRRLAASAAALEVLEAGCRSAVAHQVRWAQALEHGSALALFVETPRGMEPENFSSHFETCGCVYWRWFLAQGVEREIRTVLDVGCGGGHATEHFLRRGFDVTGVTCNADEMGECRRRGIRVLAQDFHFLGVPDGSFDMVFSSHSLEHSVSPLFALAEWKRVVRPGGYVMIVVPMPIDGDLRAAFPEHYDPAADALDFAATVGETLSADCLLSADYTCGISPHVFVLSYWQLAWLFRLGGLEMVAGGVEDAISGKADGLAHVDGRLPRDPRRALNGLFLLRKPSGGAQPSSAA